MRPNSAVVLAFFSIQALAVILTWRLQPSGCVAVAGVTLTFVFNAVSTVLFFVAIDEILPWYVDR